jgi:hypothetical protein
MCHIMFCKPITLWLLIYIIENVHLLDNSSVFYTSLLDVRLPEDDFKEVETRRSVSGLYVVTVRLSSNFIIGCWGYTLDREDRVS